jgi:hypothetical protein
MSALVLGEARIRSPLTRTCIKGSSAAYGMSDAVGCGIVEDGLASEVEDEDGRADALGAAEASPVACGARRTTIASPTATASNTTALPATATPSARG